MERNSTSPATVFDRDELIARCLGDLEFAERILSRFQSRFQEDWSELERAVSQRNAEQTACVAHRLKGASANAAAHAIRERAAEIEKLARGQSLLEIPACLEELQQDWSRFHQSAGLPGGE